MHGLITWCGFLGGWLLVAGPIFQASIELHEEEFERDSIVSAASSMEPEPKVSGWWWLVPPVYWKRAHDRRQRQRKAIFAALTTEQREQFTSFVAKASGWMIVAAGAFCIAVMETFHLVEMYDLPVVVFWVLVVVMPVLSFSYTVLSLSRSRRLREAYDH